MQRKNLVLILTNLIVALILILSACAPAAPAPTTAPPAAAPAVPAPTAIAPVGVVPAITVFSEGKPDDWGKVHNDIASYLVQQMKANPNVTPDAAAIQNWTSAYEHVEVPAVDLSQPLDSQAIAESMRNTANSVSGIFTAIQSEMPLPKLLAEIDNQEKTASQKLSGDDLIFFQGLCSIARESSSLWAPKIQGGGALLDQVPLTSIPQVPQTAVSKGKHHPNWWQIALFDAGAYVYAIKFLHYTKYQAVIYAAQKSAWFAHQYI